MKTPLVTSVAGPYLEYYRKTFLHGMQRQLYGSAGASSA